MTTLEKRMSTTALQIKPQDYFLVQTQGIINMTVGEPNFSTPEHIKTAAKTAIDSLPVRYTLPQDKVELTQAIADFLAAKYQLHYLPDSEIVTTIGVTAGVFTTLKALLNPGDEVLLPTPCFTIYEPNIRLNQGVPVIIDTSQTDFRLDPAVLEQTLIQHPHAKAIILNYPNNPTGVTYTKEQLQALAAVLARYQLFVISDEIYSELSYDVPHTSLAQLLPEQTLLLNGVSKSHAMTGYRIGYVTGPEQLIKIIKKMHAFLVTVPSNPAQAPATEALVNGDADPLTARKIYQKRRDYVMQS
ncbi:aminotransferase class I/II-fold pyridoxal phosphate-dependent enzyme [Lactobacillus sp. XV13L]|nr:aminotransferase class I/II-fold pyridoxal phosphate-dependent enzyme [Lactobacillus sp. XV13L]